MRTLRARLLAALTLAIVFALAFTPSSPAATYVFAGKIGETAALAGGVPDLGRPIVAEQKATIAGRNVYDQDTLTHKVFWSRYAGGKVWRHGVVPALSGVVNERDALVRWGFRPGLLWRTGALNGSSATADQILTAQLNPRGLIVDLRTSGAASARPDPSLPGVARVRYGINSGFADDYRKYATDSGARTSIGRAVQAIAGSPGPVLVHCAKGKDRTGIVVVVIMAILGADQAAIRSEYRRTPDTTDGDLEAFLDAVATRYGAKDATASMTPGQQWVGDVTGAGMYWYARDGLGLSESTLDALRAKFGA